MGVEDARRIALALTLIIAHAAIHIDAAPVTESTELETYDDEGAGCYYNFQHYGEGDRIMTNEPCLNCTCHNRMLMCYLRVCPFTKPIGQDCTVEKRGDQCCPIITCPDVRVDLVDSTTISSSVDSTEVGHHDSYGCSINKRFYSDGAQVPSNPEKPCELCYCIRNMTACVMQECTLHVEGCTPVYQRGTCCPVRYSCEHPEEDGPLMIEDATTTTVRPTPGYILTTTMQPGFTAECTHNERIFADGASIPTEQACEHCYCMKGDIVCAVQECGTPMENEGKNCTAIAPKAGQCCPDTYICEGDEPSTIEPAERNKLTTIPAQELEHDKPTTVSPQAPDHDEHATVSPQAPDHEEDEHATLLPQAPEHDEHATTVSPHAPVHEDDEHATMSPQAPDHEEDEHATLLPQAPEHDEHATTVSPQAPVHEDDEHATMSPQAPEDDRATTVSPHVPKHDQISTSLPHVPGDEKESTEDSQPATESAHVSDDEKIATEPSLADKTTPISQEDLISVTEKRKPELPEVLSTTEAQLDVTTVQRDEHTTAKHDEEATVSDTHEDKETSTRVTLDKTPQHRDDISAEVEHVTEGKPSVPKEDDHVTEKPKEHIDSEATTTSAIEDEIVTGEPDKTEKEPVAMDHVTEVHVSPEPAAHTTQKPSSTVSDETSNEIEGFPDQQLETDGFEQRPEDIPHVTSKPIIPVEKTHEVKPTEVAEHEPTEAHIDQEIVTEPAHVPSDAPESHVTEEAVQSTEEPKEKPSIEDEIQEPHVTKGPEFVTKHGEQKPETSTSAKVDQEDHTQSTPGLEKHEEGSGDDIPEDFQHTTIKYHDGEVGSGDETTKPTEKPIKRVEDVSESQELETDKKVMDVSSEISHEFDSTEDTSIEDASHKPEEPEIETHTTMQPSQEAVHSEEHTVSPHLDESVEKESEKPSDEKKPIDEESKIPVEESTQVLHEQSITTISPVEKAGSTSPSQGEEDIFTVVDKKSSTELPEGEPSDKPDFSIFDQTDKPQEGEIHDRVSDTDSGEKLDVPSSSQETSSQGPVVTEPVEITEGSEIEKDSTTRLPDVKHPVFEHVTPGKEQESTTFGAEHTTVSDKHIPEEQTTDEPKLPIDEDKSTESQVHDVTTSHPEHVQKTEKPLDSQTTEADIQVDTTKHPEDVSKVTESHEKQPEDSENVVPVDVTASYPEDTQHTEKPEHHTTQTAIQIEIEDDVTTPQAHKEFTVREHEVEHTTLREEITAAPHDNEADNEIIQEEGYHYPQPPYSPPRIPGEGNCLIDGISYSNYDLIPSTNKCQTSCRCVDSIVKCEHVKCSPPPSHLKNCQAVYHTKEACCPMYTCEHVESDVIESENQMSQEVDEDLPQQTEASPHEVVEEPIVPSVYKPDCDSDSGCEIQTKKPSEIEQQTEKHIPEEAQVSTRAPQPEKEEPGIKFTTRRFKPETVTPSIVHEATPSVEEDQVTEKKEEYGTTPTAEHERKTTVETKYPQVQDQHTTTVPSLSSSEEEDDATEKPGAVEVPVVPSDDFTLRPTVDDRKPVDVETEKQTTISSEEDSVQTTIRPKIDATTVSIDDVNKIGVSVLPTDSVDDIIPQTPDKDCEEEGCKVEAHYTRYPIDKTSGPTTPSTSNVQKCGPHGCEDDEQNAIGSDDLGKPVCGPNGCAPEMKPESEKPKPTEVPIVPEHDVTEKSGQPEVESTTAPKKEDADKDITSAEEDLVTTAFPPIEENTDEQCEGDSCAIESVTTSSQKPDQEHTEAPSDVDSQKPEPIPSSSEEPHVTTIHEEQKTSTPSISDADKEAKPTDATTQTSYTIKTVEKAGDSEKSTPTELDQHTTESVLSQETTPSRIYHHHTIPEKYHKYPTILETTPQAPADDDKELVTEKDIVEDSVQTTVSPHIDTSTPAVSESGGEEIDRHTTESVLSQETTPSRIYHYHTIPEKYHKYPSILETTPHAPADDDKELTDKDIVEDSVQTTVSPHIDTSTPAVSESDGEEKVEDSEKSTPTELDKHTTESILSQETTPSRIYHHHTIPEKYHKYPTILETTPHAPADDDKEVTEKDIVEDSVQTTVSPHIDTSTPAVSESDGEEKVEDSEKSTPTELDKHTTESILSQETTPSRIYHHHTIPEKYHKYPTILETTPHTELKPADDDKEVTEKDIVEDSVQTTVSPHIDTSTPAVSESDGEEKVEDSEKSTPTELDKHTTESILSQETTPSRIYHHHTIPEKYHKYPTILETTPHTELKPADDDKEVTEKDIVEDSVQTTVSPHIDTSTPAVSESGGEEIDRHTTESVLSQETTPSRIYHHHTIPEKYHKYPTIIETTPHAELKPADDVKEKPSDESAIDHSTRTPDERVTVPQSLDVDSSTEISKDAEESTQLELHHTTSQPIQDATEHATHKPEDHTSHDVHTTVASKDATDAPIHETTIFAERTKEPHTHTEVEEELGSGDDRHKPEDAPKKPIDIEHDEGVSSEEKPDEIESQKPVSDLDSTKPTYADDERATTTSSVDDKQETPVDDTKHHEEELQTKAPEVTPSEQEPLKPVDHVAVTPADSGEQDYTKQPEGVHDITTEAALDHTEVPKHDVTEKVAPSVDHEPSSVHDHDQSTPAYEVHETKPHVSEHADEHTTPSDVYEDKEHAPTTVKSVETTDKEPSKIEDVEPEVTISDEKVHVTTEVSHEQDSEEQTESSIEKDKPHVDVVQTTVQPSSELEKQTTVVFTPKAGQPSTPSSHPIVTDEHDEEDIDTTTVAVMKEHVDIHPTERPHVEIPSSTTEDEEKPIDSDEIVPTTVKSVEHDTSAPVEEMELHTESAIPSDQKKPESDDHTLDHTEREHTDAVTEGIPSVTTVKDQESIGDRFSEDEEKEKPVPVDHTTVQPQAETTHAHSEPSRDATTVQPHVETSAHPHVKDTVPPHVEATSQPTDSDLGTTPQIQDSVHEEVETTDKPHDEATVEPEVVTTVHDHADKDASPEIPEESHTTVQPSAETTAQPQAVSSIQPHERTSAHPQDTESQTTVHPHAEKTVQPQAETTVQSQSVEPHVTPQPEDVEVSHAETTISPDADGVEHGIQPHDITVQPQAETTIQEHADATEAPHKETTVHPHLEDSEQTKEPQTTVAPSLDEIEQVHTTLQPHAETTVQSHEEGTKSPVVFTDRTHAQTTPYAEHEATTPVHSEEEKPTESQPDTDTHPQDETPIEPHIETTPQSDTHAETTAQPQHETTVQPQAETTAPAHAETTVESHTTQRHVETTPQPAVQSTTDLIIDYISSKIPFLSSTKQPDETTKHTTTPAEEEATIPEEDVDQHEAQEPQVPDFSGSYGTSGPDSDYDEGETFGPGTCRYGGHVYVSAQQIPRDDPCDFCFCFRSDIICLQQSCPPPIQHCREEPIQGFCCPRYECPVSMATVMNVTTTTTTTTTTLPPHFLSHAYKGQAQRRGCQIDGHVYKVGEVIKQTSGPCLHCICGADGQMKCDPKKCTPEPMLRQMIAVAATQRRRR